jgi:hypothetical protein
MQIDIAFFDALRQANVPEIAARAAAESLAHEIDRRYDIHAKQLTTSSDFAKLDTKFEAFGAELKVEMATLRVEIQTIRADLSKQLVDQQRWTLAYVFAMLGCVMAYQRYLA